MLTEMVGNQINRVGQLTRATWEYKELNKNGELNPYEHWQFDQQPKY